MRRRAAWEDNCQLLFNNSTPGYGFDVTFNAPAEADYALGANLVTGPGYGKEVFYLDPGSNGPQLYGLEQFDAYSSSVSAQYVFLGSVHLTAGPHVLQVQVVGSDAGGYDAGINFLEVAQVTSTKAATFQAAMNNQGIAYDNSSTTMTSNFDLTGIATGRNLSEQSLASGTGGAGPSRWRARPATRGRVTRSA